MLDIESFVRATIDGPFGFVSGGDSIVSEVKSKEWSAAIGSLVGTALWLKVAMTAYERWM